jgi:hypothetical protein
MVQFDYLACISFFELYSIAYSWLLAHCWMKAADADTDAVIVVVGIYSSGS